MNPKISPKRALIVVDMQNDFMSTGPLAVRCPPAESLVPTINDLMAGNGYAKIVFTQDWHPVNHCSFARNLGVAEFTQTRTPKGRTQVAWPVHCVADTRGAALVVGLNVPHDAHIVRKGCDPDFDSYSGFLDDGGHQTGLADWLRAHGITDVDVVGVATEYCVRATAVDAAQSGFRVRVLADAVGAVTAEGGARTLADFATGRSGVTVA